VVTISNAEREKFLMLCMEEGVDAISYGNGVTAKEAAQEFKDGKGECLVGTAANYSEGVDLPKQLAPVIFFLRPGYPNPKDPGTIFEERRWGGQRWVLWNYRIMNQALQVRGRNIRRQSDLGVTIFVSQQFKRILFASLPEWLEKAYRNGFTLDQALADAEKLLQ
jgi:Rad3-related DNA helicase